MPALSLRLSVILPLAFAAASAGCVDISAGDQRYVDTVEKRFSVSGTPSLDVSTFDGSIEVSTWDRPEVVVVVEKHAIDKTAADRMVVTAEQSGDRIRVDVRDTRESGFQLNFGSHGARVTVTAPAQLQLEAETGDGRIEVRQVEGPISVRTGDGSIRLDRIKGSIEAASGDGSIEVDGSTGPVRVRSGDGRVRVRAVSIDPAGEWSLTTGDGSIVLEVPDGFNADLDASTGDGRVSVQDLPFDGETTSRRRRSARGQIGSGGPTIRIRSGDGSITVRRSDFQATSQ